MKGNKKVLVVAVLLLLIAVSYTTYAIYKTSVAGNAEVTAATWAVEFKDGATTIEDTDTITFTGAECTNAHVAEGKIAPGATCTKTITLDASGTEVDVAYTVSTGTVTAEKGGSAVPTTTITNANAFTATLSPANGTIPMTGSQTQELTLTVTWAGTDDSETDTINGADTDLNGATITVPVTLVAKQVPVSAS